MRDGMRRITHCVAIVCMEGDIITSQTLFSYEFQGEGKDGLLLGSFKSSGLRPHFAPNAAYFSLDKPLLEAMGCRSEEHTSELQSLMRISYAVFCLKKKKTHLHLHNFISYITLHMKK